LCLVSALFREMRHLVLNVPPTYVDKWCERPVDCLADLVAHCPNLTRIRLENGTKLPVDFKQNLHANPMIKSRSRLVRFVFV